MDYEYNGEYDRGFDRGTTQGYVRLEETGKLFGIVRDDGGQRKFLVGHHTDNGAGFFKIPEEQMSVRSLGYVAKGTPATGYTAQWGRVPVLLDVELLMRTLHAYLGDVRSDRELDFLASADLDAIVRASNQIADYDLSMGSASFRLNPL